MDLKIYFHNRNETQTASHLSSCLDNSSSWGGSLLGFLGGSSLLGGSLLGNLLGSSLLGNGLLGDLLGSSLLGSDLLGSSLLSNNLGYKNELGIGISFKFAQAITPMMQELKQL